MYKMQKIPSDVAQYAIRIDETFKPLIYLFAKKYTMLENITSQKRFKKSMLNQRKKTINWPRMLIIYIRGKMVIYQQQTIP